MSGGHREASLLISHADPSVAVANPGGNGPNDNPTTWATQMPANPAAKWDAARMMRRLVAALITQSPVRWRP
jgi:hypothetical protein